MEDENKNVEDDFLFPSHVCDERYKDGFVFVILWIRGLKTSSEIVFKGILPKKIRKPSNAKIDINFDERSFSASVFGESGDMKWKKYQLKIRQLPGDIIPDKSYFEVENERVLLYLCKKEDKSWYPEMHNGLETAEEDEK